MVSWYHVKNKSSRYIMSYIIGMVSQKGGAGKSTLARLFARELAKDGFSVKIADLDTQQTTCTEWAADRAEAQIEPEIQVQPHEAVRTVRCEKRAWNYGLAT